MTTETLPRLDIPGGDGDDGEDEFQHLYCCDPDRSLCGLDLTGVEEQDVDEEDECPWCVTLAEIEAPCGTRGCPNPGPL